MAPETILEKHALYLFLCSAGGAGGDRGGAADVHGSVYGSGESGTEEAHPAANPRLR